MQLVCQCNDVGLTRMIKTNLGPDAPVMEEDVEVSERKIFRALEYIEEPDELQVEDTLIWAIWTMGGDPLEEAEEKMQALHRAGATKILAYIWADEFEEIFIIERGKLKRLRSWDRTEYSNLEEGTAAEIAFLKRLQRTAFTVE